ncbi:hypothetical protein P8452_13801 [Trifolium repens]|nr:hypothetical protein P8452_13801 [Trifolium repens]
MADNALAEVLGLVAAAMREQTDTLRQMRGNGGGNNAGGAAPADPRYTGLSEFRKNNPPPFRGSPDPVEAEEWLLKVAEQKMEALGAEKPKEKFNSGDKKFHNKDNKFQKNLRPMSTISKDKPIQAAATSNSKGCGRCGFNHGDQSCPAIRSTCLKCGKLGHFARCCKTGGQSQPRPQNQGRVFSLQGERVNESDDRIKETLTETRTVGDGED